MEQCAFGLASDLLCFYSEVPFSLQTSVPREIICFIVKNQETATKHTKTMQQHDSFIAACQSIPSRVHIIPPHESLATVLEWVQDQPAGTDWSNTLVALDFDQTITHVRPTAEGGRQLGIRGGQASVHALRTAPPHRERC